MLKAFKYRLYPTVKQTVLLNKHFGCVRYVYNWALAEKMKAYQTEGKTLSRFELDKQLTGKKKELDWLSEVNSQSLRTPDARPLVGRSSGIKTFGRSIYAVLPGQERFS